MGPPVSVKRHASGLGELELASRPPHPALRRHVLRIQGYRERTPQPLRRVEPPQGAATLILSFGPALRLPDADMTLGSFVAGPDDAFTLTEHDGEAFGLQVDLTPFGARLLFGLPPGELARSVAPIEDVLGRPGPLLVERLADGGSWEERFAGLEAELVSRLRDAAPPPARVEWAWRRLVDSGGSASVGDLAAEVGWSRRHFGARFREHVGLPPKLVGRIARFRRALAMLQTGSAGLAEIAYACGYADQAHLSREVRAFAGATPTGLAARLLPDGLGIAADRR
jgi:AraC-like DNA-binding protein